MSTKHRLRLISILLNALRLALCIVCLPFIAAGQRPSFEIRVLPEGHRIAVEGRMPPARACSFRDSYGGVVGLGKRIQQFALFDGDGKGVELRQIAPGHFDSQQPSGHFRYEVDLTAPARSSDSATVSWLTRDRGLLMLTDLLPVSSTDQKTLHSATIKFSLPDGWTVYPNHAGSQAVPLDVSDVDRAVFVVGARLRANRIDVAGLSFDYVSDGDWAFADRDAIDLAMQILRAHRETFGGLPANSPQLIVLPFPQAAAPSQWAAETRGSTVTLLLGKLPSKNAALAQLSTPLTHELMHLWVPNGLWLDGDYDWFYEGFTVYEAARTAVRLGLLTFPEFLNAMARAYDGYLGNDDRDRLSLMEASVRRWTVGQTSVYSKSMLVAFLYDLHVRADSRRKKTLENAYRVLFKEYGRTRPEAGEPSIDGNTAAITSLGFDRSMTTFVEKNVKTPVAIDLKSELAPYGLVVESSGLRTRINVSDQLTKPQRELLRDLGYNDAVRTPRK
jgi:predicted metalloprotease with PDZ domain